MEEQTSGYMYSKYFALLITFVICHSMTTGKINLGFSNGFMKITRDVKNEVIKRISTV